MQFLRENVTFYDAVKMIFDVITTANPFQYTAKFIFVCVRNDKTRLIRRLKINRIRMSCCRISKISNSVGRNDNFRAKARKLSILPTSLDIYDIQQHYIRILYFYNSHLDLKRICIFTMIFIFSPFWFEFRTKCILLYNGNEIQEFPSVINFDIITSDDINFHFLP